MTLSTLAIWAWTGISAVRWIAVWGFTDVDDPNCFEGVVFGFGNRSAHCEVVLHEYHARLANVFDEWWMVTVVLCLIWFMVRYRAEK